MEYVPAGGEQRCSLLYRIQAVEEVVVRRLPAKAEDLQVQAIGSKATEEESSSDLCCH